MRTSVVYSNEALRQLKKLDVAIAKRILRKISENASQPDPLERAKELKGTLAGKYRYRIGDYRAIFIVNDSGNIALLTILNVQHKKDIYR